MIKRQVERGEERVREKRGTRERPDGMTKRVIIVRLI